jgi:hypothetical protein
MPAIPIIASGISAFSAYKQGRAAQQAAGQQQAAAGQLSNLSKSIMGFGNKQFSLGAPALGQALKHYTALTMGNRGEINSALAPDRAQIAEGYTGAEQGMIARMAPGPTRDKAIADLYRQKAGQLGLLPFQARQNAVNQLGGIGSGLVEGAGRSMSSAANPLSAAGNLYENAGQNQANAWGAYGNIAVNAAQGAQGVYDWYKNRYGKNTGVAGGYTPNDTNGWG